MTLGLNTAHDASGISYLASDGLGSVSEALSPSGSATGAQLYSPYGGVRYSSGTMPTAKGFTGQYSDASSTGLDYYGARYYDPALGQFTSADTVSDGLNRYGYVKGNPETATDPTGHRLSVGDAGSCGTNGSSKGYNQPSTHKPNSNKSPVWDSAADALDVQGFHIALVRRQTAINLAKARARTVEVSGYTKGNGTQVEPYTRRAPGSKAWDEELTGREKLLGRMSAVLLVAGFVVDAIGEGNDYYDSHPDEPQEVRVLNAVATGVAHASIVTASVAIGAVVGQALIPIPFVGDFIGGVIGGVIGDQLADAAVSPIMNNPNPEAGPDDAPIPDVVPGL